MTPQLTLVSSADNSVGTVAGRLGRLEEALRGRAMQTALNAGGAVLMKAVRKNARPIKNSGLLNKKIKLVRKKRVTQLGESWVGIGVEKGQFPAQVQVGQRRYARAARPDIYSNMVEHGGHFGKKPGKYTPARPLFKAALRSAAGEVQKAVLGSLDKQIIAALKKGKAR